MPYLVADATQWREFYSTVEREPVLALALRTTGADPFSENITHIALAGQKTAAVLDAAALGGPAALRELLGPLLQSKAKVKAFHNAKAACRYLLPLGLTPVRIFDSMLAEQLLSAGEMTAEPALSDLLHRHLPTPEARAAVEPDGPQALAAEARAIYGLRRKLVPLLVQADLVRCAQLEFECTVPTAAMEHAGLRLDLARLHELIAAGIRRMEQCTEAFVRSFDPSQQDLFGAAALNLHSDAQVLRFLQQHGVPVQRVNRSTLQPLLKQYPALQHLLDYRSAALDRALESYLDAVHPLTGRIHPTYSQLAASTGRFGCSNPNMQSFPRSPAHRSCVVPAPGKVLVLADYSQIELRIAAQISRDPRMLSTFQNNGDLHVHTASILTDKPPAQVTKAERQAAKAVNFGLIYAMGARGLAAYAAQTYGVEMSLANAEQFRARYFAAYHGVQAWHARVRRQQPQVVRTLSGRMRRVPAGQLSQALNAPVQGTGADILKRALALLYPALQPLSAQIIGVVHDEILVETPITQAEATARTVSQAMEQAAREFLPDVPCPVEARVATSWADKS